MRMALVESLPNGHLVILLTPREASLLCDQILEPNDFPWQGNESQVVAFEVKQRIRSQLETHLRAEIGVIGMMTMQKLHEVPTDEPEGEPVPVPDDEDEDTDESE